MVLYIQKMSGNYSISAVESTVFVLDMRNPQQIQSLERYLQHAFRRTYCIFKREKLKRCKTSSISFKANDVCKKIAVGRTHYINLITNTKEIREER